MRTWSMPARIRAGTSRGRMNQMSLNPVLAPRRGRLGSRQYATPVATLARMRRTTAERSSGKPRGMRALYDTPWAILLWSRLVAALLHAPDDSVEALHSRAGGAAAASRGGRVEVLARPRRGPALGAAGAG